MPKIYGNTTATPLGMDKMADKIAEPLMRSEGLYNNCPGTSSLGGDDYHHFVSIYESSPVDLKAGETYVFSIVAPKIGASVTWSNLGTLHYVGDRYTAKVTLKNDITTLENTYLTFDRNSPNDSVNIKAIIIEKKSPIREQFDVLDDRTIALIEKSIDIDTRVFDLEENVGDIESALDGIITIQNNLIGGEG